MCVDGMHHLFYDLFSVATQQRAHTTTLGIYNTYSIPVTCYTAYIALTLGAAPLGFGTV